MKMPIHVMLRQQQFEALLEQIILDADLRR